MTLNVRLSVPMALARVPTVWFARAARMNTTWMRASHMAPACLQKCRKCQANSWIRLFSHRGNSPSTSLMAVPAQMPQGKTNEVNSNIFLILSCIWSFLKHFFHDLYFSVLVILFIFRHSFIMFIIVFY